MFNKYKKYQLTVVAIVSLLCVTNTQANVKTVVDSGGTIKSLKNLKSVTSVNNKPVNTLDIKKFITKKGTPVLFVKTNQLPIVDVRITFNAGSARDAWMTDKYKQSLQGVASMTASMLNKGTDGTEPLSENQIANVIEKNGFRFSAMAYKDMFAVSMRSLSSPVFLDQSTHLLNNMLANASFSHSSLDRVKNQTLIGLKQQEKSPQYIASTELSKAIYGSHPYALPSSGTQESLPNIQRKHLLTFKNKFLVAKNASIAITGDVSYERAQELAEKITQELTVGTKAEPLIQPKTPKPQHIHIPFESSQTTIMAGQLGIARKDAQSFDLLVANQVFGGGDFQALLMQELRKKRGLTYGVYSGFTRMQSLGPFTISFSTRSEKTKIALNVMKKTLDDYLQNGAQKTSIADTKLSMVNKFPLGLTTNSSINNMLSMLAFYDMPLDYISDYQKRIMAVTQDSANSAFANKVTNKNMIVVTVGPNNPKK